MKYLTLAWIQCSHLFHRLMKEEKGASAIEYVLIAAVIVGAVSLLDLNTLISDAGTHLINVVKSAGVSTTAGN
ncbi:hypothetical protein KDD30_23790 (plasmid) [Photobacterium sp. GJ3]|uniref:Flp family type IVb pilin n=1 Tax=Photobacterium sp. GJ3 TaxID=2829502 RepID=UPI001B8C63A7|nr:hypothetical protein [Photobacterium sp. GJ3]QUJ69744.1 hypothetical protein KDD30_23790 [Photobacterium sp. GJ3]